MQNPFLGVTKTTGNGIDESVTKVEIEDGVNAGIRWRSLGTNMVPIFEEHSSRIERNISLGDWMTMDVMDRAMIIAIRRIDIASKNHQAEAESKKIKNESRRK
jgi:hypothetical protein